MGICRIRALQNLWKKRAIGWASSGYKDATKEADYIKTRNTILNDRGKDVFNAAVLIAIDERYANQKWRTDGNGKNGGISCDGFVALAMHEANLDLPKNNKNIDVPDTTYVSTSGYSKSGLYYQITNPQIGDVVVIRAGLAGKTSAEHSHAAILGNVKLIRNKNGNVISLREAIQSSGGNKTINLGSEIPKNYYKNKFSLDWETKEYYRRKIQMGIL